VLSALDLFAGAGGLSCGLKEVGIHIVGAIEIDRFAAQTYRANLPSHRFYHRSITPQSGSKKRSPESMSLQEGRPAKGSQWPDRRNTVISTPGTRLFLRWGACSRAKASVRLA
jgi:site-specific DNA-cytosine methylase